MAVTGPARAGPRVVGRMAGQAHLGAAAAACIRGRALSRLNPLPTRALLRPADQPSPGCRMPADVDTDGTGVAGRERMPFYLPETAPQHRRHSHGPQTGGRSHSG
jgi:hypothetical protein